jgi:hypothetical protein
MNRSRHAFTLAELVIAMLVFSMVSVGLFSFASASLRLVGRNLATNHSHESMRISGQTLLNELHDSASAFRLVDFDGTNYTDSSPTVSADQDAYTKQYASSRANGVRFRAKSGGPYQLTANTTSTSTTLTFNFSVGGKLPYLPHVGDKVVLPLVAKEFDITKVTPDPFTDTTTATRVITITDGTASFGGVGYAFDTTTTGNLTTGYFYREVAFTVYNNELRYHAEYNGTKKSNYTVVRDKITSPKPFALLYSTSTSTTTDGLNLRLSLEYYDTNYSARKFTAGTITLQATVPPRVRPPLVSSTNAS